MVSVDPPPSAASPFPRHPPIQGPQLPADGRYWRQAMLRAPIHHAATCWRAARAEPTLPNWRTAAVGSCAREKTYQIRKVVGQPPQPLSMRRWRWPPRGS